jgi:hypothetical protein
MGERRSVAGQLRHVQAEQDWSRPEAIESRATTGKTVLRP